MSPETANQQAAGEVAVSVAASDDDQSGYTFGPLDDGNFFKVEQTIKTPPGTPGLPLNFQEHVFSNSADQAWSYVAQDEPLPTPSLCSHGGSEVDFAIGRPQLPGYVATSQPVTPSFNTPNIGGSYGFFANAPGPVSNPEYAFQDSYGADASARSSPGQPKSKHFQFTQNVTPQDFTGTPHGAMIEK
jgi:hypothetical protein